jgi:guanylate kinase
VPFNQNLSPKVREELSKKILIPLVGPSSVGKTTVMRAVVDLHPDFARSSGFTTRPRREEEEADTYRFLDNSEQQRNDIIKKFQDGELIQFAIHPTTGYLYGTSLKDYSAQFNLLDTLSSEVVNFQALGFAACRTIMIVATPAEWQQRFDSREFGAEEAQKRIIEGIDSLKWGLEQHGGVRWIENPEAGMGSTVDHIVAIANNELHENDTKARKIGEELLTHLESRLR